MNTLIPHTQLPYSSQEQLLLDARSARTAYFTRIPWQYFSTHFITRPSSDAHHRGIWYEYLNRVRELHRDTLAYLIGTALYVAVTVLFYGLFKPVNRTVASLAAFLSLVGCAIQAFSWETVSPIRRTCSSQYVEVDGKQYDKLDKQFSFEEGFRLVEIIALADYGSVTSRKIPSRCRRPEHSTR